MKKLILVATFVLTAATQGFAWEQPRNPDRFPSFGVAYGSSRTTGTRDEIDSPNPLLTRDNIGDVHSQDYTIGTDFRFPFSDNGTLQLGYDFLGNHNYFTRADGVYREDEKSTGYRFSVGVRVYLNQ